MWHALSGNTGSKRIAATIISPDLSGMMLIDSVSASSIVMPPIVEFLKTTTNGRSYLRSLRISAIAADVESSVNDSNTKYVIFLIILLSE